MILNQAPSVPFSNAEVRYRKLGKTLENPTLVMLRIDTPDKPNLSVRKRPRLRFFIRIKAPVMAGPVGHPRRPVLKTICGGWRAKQLSGVPTGLSPSQVSG